MVLMCLGGAGKDPTLSLPLLEGAEISMEPDIGKLVIIETGTAQFLVTNIETQRLDQMQTRAAVGAKPDDIAGIGGNFRLKQGDMKHAGSGFFKVEFEVLSRLQQGAVAETVPFTDLGDADIEFTRDRPQGIAILNGIADRFGLFSL